MNLGQDQIGGVQGDGDLITEFGRFEKDLLDMRPIGLSRLSAEVGQSRQGDNAARQGSRFGTSQVGGGQL